jgi:hypothetical protein
VDEEVIEGPKDSGGLRTALGSGPRVQPLCGIDVQAMGRLVGAAAGAGGHGSGAWHRRMHGRGGRGGVA